MERFKKYIRIKSFNRKLLVIIGIVLVFGGMVYGFLFHKTIKKNVEFLSPYVDNCSFTYELIDGMILEQSFYTNFDVIEGIYLETATFARKNTSNIKITIINEGNEKICQESFSLEDAIDNQFSYFILENPLSINSDEELILRMEAVGNTGGNGICLVYSNYDSYRNGKFTINGEIQQGDCFFGIAGYRYNKIASNPLYIGGIVFLLLYLILSSVLIIYKQNIKEENKIFFIGLSYIKIIKLILLFCAVISIGRIDYKVINSISERMQIEYSVHIANPELVRVDKDGIEIEFINHAKEIISNNIIISRINSYSGTVSYIISDMEGDVIHKKSESILSIINFYNDDWDELVFDCFNLELKQGKKYKITLDFNETEPIYIITNQEGKLWQRQIMKNSYETVYKVVVLIISIIMLLIIAYILIIEFSNKVFLIAALTTGIFACFIQTPCATDDEYRHFLRVYDLAESRVQAEHIDNWTYINGDFIIGNDNEENIDNGIYTKGNIIINSDNKIDIIEVPAQINGLRLLDRTANYDNVSYEAEMNYKGCIDELFRLVNYEEDESSYVSIAATYDIPLLVYFPQVFLTFIGKLLGMNGIGMYYMARLGNMLFATIITYIIIIKLPKYKNIFLVTYFAPNSLWIRSSCNRDAFVTTVVLLLIAYILYIKENKLQLFNVKRIVILGIFTVIIAISKLPYILIAGLIIILDKSNLHNLTNWKCFFAKVAFIVVLGIAGVVGYKIIYYTPNSENGINVENSVTEKDHITYAVENPQKVIVTFVNRLDDIFEDIYRAFEGYKFLFTYKYIIMAFVILLISKNNMNMKGKLWILFIFMACWICIIVVGYTMKPPDFGYIWGINPRYMIPMLPLVGFIVAIGNDRMNKICNLIAPTWILILTSLNIISMISIYW